MRPQHAVAPLSTPCGALTARCGDMVLGWAWNPASPTARLAVELYVDGVFVALVRADQAQPEPAAGDGFHGLAARLRPDWLLPGSVISARVANGGPWLDGDLTIETPPETVQGVPDGPVPAAPGQVWYTGGLGVRGWAWQPQNPQHTVQVAVYQGNTCVARATANGWHPMFAQHANPAHGFELNLPWSLADGKTHTLHVLDDTGALLTDGVIRVCVHPEGMSALVPDPEKHSLLARLARDQDRRYPRNAGFAHYPQWHAQFGAPPSPPTPPRGRVHVLLMGPADAAAQQRSEASLQAQTLPPAQWQCTNLNDVLEGAAEDDQPLVVRLRALARGCALLVPLQRGDTLAPHALATWLQHLDSPTVAWGYADCDQDDPDGRRTNPWFKPAWDATLFCGTDLITPGCALGADAWLAGLDALEQTTTPPPVHWHSLLAAVVLATRGQVCHLPWVLYHRQARAPAWPHLFLPDPARQAAVQWLLNEQGSNAQATLHPHYPGLLQVRRALPALAGGLPRVSLVVPTRDQLPLLRACVDGLLERTDYPNLEVLVVDNESRHPDTLAYLQALEARPAGPGGTTVRVLRYPHPFNYSAINNWAAAQASGEILGLVNNDIEVLQPDWLQHMVAHLLRPGVGAVGAKLRWPNGMVQHGGVVVGVYDLAAHAGNTWLHSDPGYLGLNQLDRQCSAVTAACLLVRRETFEQLGGLHEARYPVTFNDVDFCLRLRECGLSVIWSAQAELVHAESASRGKDDSPPAHQRARREQGHFRADWARWNEQGDPFYHPALAADFAGGPYSGLALPPRPRQRRTLLVTNNV